MRAEFMQLLWFAGGVIVAFLGIYVATNKIDLLAVLRQGWRLSLVLGVLAAAIVLFNIVTRQPATPHPGGSYFGFELLWRGPFLALTDTLLVRLFPTLVALTMLNGNIDGFTRRIVFMAVMLAMTSLITATYHLGYTQYRESGLGYPELANAVMSLPAIVSANPIGSFVADATMHMTANIHSYESRVLLPPPVRAAP